MRILVRSESKEDELTEEEDKLKDADFKNLTSKNPHTTQF